MSRVLIVEDEAHLAQGLSFNLREEGHTADVVGDGESALDRLIAKRQLYDAVVLDVMLPGKSGFDVATTLREHKNYVPILMLTARGRPEDVLQGFAAGADDYLPKPFELSILIARLDSLLRRTAWMSQANQPPPAAAKAGALAPGGEQNDSSTFYFAGKSIDFAELELHSVGNTIHLTLMEAQLLQYLVRSEGRVVSRKAILEEVWGLREDTDTRAIDNFIVRLRRYIEDDPSQPRHLQTVRGVGYRFVAEPE